MPHHTLTPEEVFTFITNDFESAWNCLAAQEDHGLGRGNFMFALQATILLEWASRLCGSDASARRDFAEALRAIRPRYFLDLPEMADLPGKTRPPRDFALLDVDRPETQLLTFIFDLVRNGQSHRYQQIAASLLGDSVLAISLGGAHFDHSLDRLKTGGGAQEHLTLQVIGKGVGTLKVDSGMLYWDIKTAIENAHLLSRGLNFPDTFTRSYEVTLDELKAALG